MFENTGHVRDCIYKNHWYQVGMLVLKYQLVNQLYKVVCGM